MRPVLARAVLFACVLLVAWADRAAACDVTSTKLEEAIADRSELREAANKQTVRDLRTLRDAAIVLDTYKFDAECVRLMAIVTKLSADPEKTIERGDTDEDKAEEVMQARKPKVVPGIDPEKSR